MAPVTRSMGAFYTNYQVRSDSTSNVVKAVGPLVQSRAYVSPPKNGWVTVYDEVSDDQNDATLREMAMGLSAALNTAVFAFVVHDSDVFLYWLFQSGRLVDEFDSDPEYFGHRVDEATRIGLRGKTAALLPLCRPGTTAADVDTVLHDPDAPSGMADELLADLAELLGMDDTRTALGFRYFEEEGEELLPDVEEFEPVGKGSEASEGTEAKVIKLFDGAAAPREPKPAREPGSDREPDPFGLAIGDLAQYWAVPEQVRTMFSPALLGDFNADEQVKQLRARFDRAAHDLLKHSKAPGRPAYEELKAARDQGPEALADMLVRFAPEQITDVAVGATANKVEQFVAALLARGLDPNARCFQGISALEVAMRHGKDSTIYQMLKSAAEQRRM